MHLEQKQSGALNVLLGVLSDLSRLKHRLINWWLDVLEIRDSSWHQDQDNFWIKFIIIINLDNLALV